MKYLIFKNTKIRSIMVLSQCLIVPEVLHHEAGGEWYQADTHWRASVLAVFLSVWVFLWWDLSSRTSGRSWSTSCWRTLCPSSCWSSGRPWSFLQLWHSSESSWSSPSSELRLLWSPFSRTLRIFLLFFIISWILNTESEMSVNSCMIWNSKLMLILIYYPSTKEDGKTPISPCSSPFHQPSSTSLSRTANFCKYGTYFEPN